jgi:flagellar secretion chaperone FliS
MAANLYARTYQDMEAASADPRHTLVLLFDGLVRYLYQAQTAMSGGDHETQCENVVRGQRILSTLMTSLDRTVAPELADSLWAMYNWMHRKLTEASIRDDVAALEDVLQTAEGLREAWRRAEKDARQGEQASEERKAA